MSILEKNLLPELNKKAESLYPSYFLNYEKMINKCCLSICYSLVKRLGQLDKKGGSFSFKELVKDKNISENSFYVLNKIFFILAEEGILGIENDTYTVKKLIDIESPSEMLVSLTRKFPQEGASFQWLARAYDGLPDILMGKIYAEDIMFPWGSFELVEDVYFNSRVYSFFPTMTGLAVKLLLKQYYRKNISILEIGAGTGNGTDSVLKHINGSCSVYYYTDIMRTMLKKAKIKYKSYPFMQYALYDINKDPVSQGLEENSFDLIIAVNVLHASNDTITALQFLKGLIKSEGCLLFSEIGPPRGSIYRYMELTFGLLSSYFSYNDTHVRSLSPIIRPGNWAKLLYKAGFAEVVFAPSGKEPVFDRGGLILGVKQ